MRFDESAKNYPASNAYGLTNVPTVFLIEPDGTIKVVCNGFDKKGAGRDRRISRRTRNISRPPHCSALTNTSPITNLVEARKTRSGLDLTLCKTSRSNRLREAASCASARAPVCLAMTRVELGAMPDSRARRRAICPTSSFFFFRFFIDLSAIPAAQKQKLSPQSASLAQYFHANNALRSNTTHSPQNVNVTCKSTRRFAVLDPYGPPANPFDCPNNGELKFPTGSARFTLLKMFRPDTANVSA